jgi:hypothetical protein
MRSKEEYFVQLDSLSKQFKFTDGFKLLYCPWQRISDARIAFISLNPGKAPKSFDQKNVEDLRGNSYLVERAVTNSPLNEQFLSMCTFLDCDPEKILTGAFFPFRSGKWQDLDARQIEAGLSFCRPFWKSAITENCELAIVLSNFVANQVVDLLGGKLEAEIPSGWGATKLRRYNAPNGTKVVQLPHLSTYRLFSRDECVAPLREVFQL